MSFTACARQHFTINYLVLRISMGQRVFSRSRDTQHTCELRSYAMEVTLMPDRDLPRGSMKCNNVLKGEVV